ncbi:MAG: RES family NAD+ phosphorylase [Rhizobium rhizophilum]|uniref:RES family NAD+ phosphorylase n=1 Tax=Rhizobium rhizophilum TaxID=1850373 RepID=UPI00391B8468
MEIADLPVSTVAHPRTVRLVSTARLRAPVLASLADDAGELAELAEIEAATSSRMQAQATGISGLSARELVYDVPHAHFINASFAYAKPREPNRFNGETRGAWYAALSVETCLAEITFHMTEFLARTGVYEAVADYAETFCSVSGEFLDLMSKPTHPALSPDKTVGYAEGNMLALEARRAGLNGIIYPSVRHAGGTCFAILRPAAVQSVRQGDVWRLTWKGRPGPKVEGPMGA